MKSNMIAKAPPLREQIVRALLDELRSGRFQPGERLTENGLAERLNVSRTPVREALNQLVEQGLIESRPRGGYLVPSPSIDEVRDIIAVRRMIEPPALRLIARHATPFDIRPIDEALAMEEKHLESADAHEFTSANENFRTSLFGGLQNKTLRAVIEQFSGHLNFIRATTLHDVALRKVIVALQRQVRDAVAENDEDLAETRWQGYLQHSEETLISTLHRLSETQASGRGGITYRK